MALRLPGQRAAEPLAREEEPERRVMGFIVALVAQLVQARFEIRLVLGEFKRRQHAAVIGAVAAVVEQGDVPVRAQRMQELQQRTGDSGNSKL